VPEPERATLAVPKSSVAPPSKLEPVAPVVEVVSSAGNVDQKIVESLSEKSFELPVPSPVQASDPNVTGVKARTADIQQSDEFYCEEYQVAPFKGELAAPVVKSLANGGWAVELGASVCGKALVHAGKVVVATYDCQVLTFELETGKLIERELGISP